MKKIILLSLALGLATQAQAEEYKIKFDTNEKPFQVPEVVEECRGQFHSTGMVRYVHGGDYIFYWDSEVLGRIDTLQDLPLRVDGYEYDSNNYVGLKSNYHWWELCRLPI
jgi:hypothetical protein